jgi:hypothetical protein
MFETITSSPTAAFIIGTVFGYLVNLLIGLRVIVNVIKTVKDIDEDDKENNCNK